MRVQYPAFGKWEVTTEGDCEGRTVRNLGIHTGFLDEIAFRLGRKSYYSLTFKLLDPNATAEVDNDKPVDAVSVTLAIDSGMWDLKNDERADAVREILKGRHVRVSEGTYYASVELSRKPEARDDR